MAVRLSVIMVQSAPPTPAAVRTAEAVVGELIGLAGIDLTLVGPIAALGDSSTDRLSLESLAGDVAVLDWQSPSQIMAALSGVGFEGQRSPHQHDQQVPAPESNQRRIYAIDLTQFSGSADVLTALLRLRADRQVRTFSLAPKQRSGSPPASQAGNQDDPAATPKPQNLEHRQPETVSTPVQHRENLDLDDLLDQLDQIDP
jgi:hypothetical protein